MDDLNFKKEYIHIRLQARNGKKKITTIQGINDVQDVEAILKELKQILHCNGSLDNDEKFGKVLRLSGDKRKEVSEFLIKEFITTKDCIKIHGE